MPTLALLKVVELREGVAAGVVHRRHGEKADAQAQRNHQGTDGHQENRLHHRALASLFSPVQESMGGHEGGVQVTYARDTP